MIQAATVLRSAVCQARALSGALSGGQASRGTQLWAPKSWNLSSRPPLSRSMAVDAGTKVPTAAVPSPAAVASVEFDSKTFTSIQEGLAKILIPPEAPLLKDPSVVRKDGEQRASVFYNPIQQYNRDLTILVIKTFGEDFIAKAQALATKRNKHPKQQKPRRPVNGKAIDHQTNQDSPTTTPKQESIQVETATNNVKRKRDIIDGVQSIDSNGTENVDKRQRIESTDVSNAAATQEPPLFSSMVKDRISTQEDVDDSFGDGGIGEDDFLLAEQNALRSKLAPGPNANATPEHLQPNGNGDSRRTPFRILDALSATGLRALRYAKEISFVTSITANDLSADAAKSIKRNIQYNEFQDPAIIRVVNNNAVAHMAGSMTNNGQKYTVIDLDPYGTAVPFLDTAVQAVSENGLLCVTCTDTAIFNSMGYLEKTFSQYGGLPVKGDFCHEAGVRLILHAIAATAGKYGISIEPLLSLSIDYYARVFVRIRRTAADVKLLGSKTMLVYNCGNGCGSWTAQPLVRVQEKTTKSGDVQFKFTSAQGPSTDPQCEHCGFKRHVAGPMWCGPLHNPAFLERLLGVLDEADPAIYQTSARVRGMVSTALEETHLYDVPESVTAKAQRSVGAKAEEEQQREKEFARVPAQVIDKHPFYFDASSLSRVLHCVAPSNAQMQGALRHQGFRCVRSHAKAGSIKTDAPFNVLWRVMKAWIKTKGEKADLRPGTAGHGIMSRLAIKNDAGSGEEKEEPREVVFDEVLGRQEASVRGLVRYQQNPRENWGPMARAKVTGRSKRDKQT